MHYKIKKLARSLGIEFRFGKTPKEAGIPKKVPKKVVACYFNGTGIVFIRTPLQQPKDYMNMVYLHEIGHAIIDNFELKARDSVHENMANAIALAFAATLRLKIPCQILGEFETYAKRR